jgi:hypothetical protein
MEEVSLLYMTQTRAGASEDHKNQVEKLLVEKRRFSLT